MSEPNIVLTRIDNRLVHGQVGVVWTSSTGANLLLVANDDTANDPLQQELMSATAESSGVGIRFWTIEKTINNIHRASARQKIFVVVRTPEDARRLLEGGVPLNNIDIGNMHFSDGKKQITKYTYMDDKDIADLKACADKGANVYVQEVPEDKKQSLEEVI
ncbi:PTS N-acetylgalactosamine transporter subunit IIB [Clostridium botulinum]|jgi:PTS system, mannose/fructose/sorbose family, IIB component|uniref:PTS galactosamine transporter subunit IIB n=1 Tax=Bacillota TaxID=1239 RepID=UPI0019221D40|nr:MULTISPECIES: PTS galactosamine transporter subunit IIB [Bacillota]MBL3531634.1 PTS N-acetylgalactosamine transporter subunit IIB [Companilactobacillus zhachilii]MCS6109239.1 PTS N-acetylgalactosamine transporter subunit IIB [Clostridium botulinum]